MTDNEIESKLNEILLRLVELSEKVSRLTEQGE